MPIRINFLAEHQAREEARRRDPVKRAALGTGAVLVLLLVWGGFLQLRLVAAKMRVKSCEAQFKQIEPKYDQALAAKSAVARARERLGALEKLGSTRILWGSCLNALQHASHPDVQLTQLQTRQSYAVSPGSPAKTNSVGAVTSPRIPGVSRETAVVLVDAKDKSPDPGKALIQGYQDLISAQPFFETNATKIRMTALRQPEKDSSGVPSATFSLECTLAERQR